MKAKAKTDDVSSRLLYVDYRAVLLSYESSWLCLLSCYLSVECGIVLVQTIARRIRKKPSVIVA